MNEIPEKRKRKAFTPEEIGVLRWLYLKTLVPVLGIVALSSTVLFLGLGSLMTKAHFGNYGLAPGTVTRSAGQFISTYLFIAVTNVILMVLLSAVVMYVILHHVVMPIMRVTGELRRRTETNEKEKISVRKTDRLIVPLVDLINRFL
ncbi:MAG: hypothetical protein ACYC5N_06070 [Endomicrobiales bacterium]